MKTLISQALLFFSLCAFTPFASAQNMLVTTGDIGSTEVTRTVLVQEFEQTFNLSYRFKTEEIPAGFFGTDFNDVFSLTLQSDSGSTELESNSMNGLGAGAFDSTGTTDWYEVTLAVQPGDTVRIIASVANVFDDRFDSSIEVNFWETVGSRPLVIESVELADVDDLQLVAFSGDDHSYFGGNTRVHGTVAVRGGLQDSLESLKLEVVQNGGVVAIGELTSGAASSLLKPFGPGGSVSVSSKQHLFDIPNSNGIDVSSNGSVTMRIAATDDTGQTHTVAVGSYPVFARYKLANRYNPRDAGVGGDDWAHPSTIAFVTQFPSHTYNDFSNMHGGDFTPDHQTHQTGLDVDGWYEGYNNLDAASAQTMLDILNRPDGRRIAIVYVTMSDVQHGELLADSEFYNHIKGKMLRDGRKATDVILDRLQHKTHYHWKVSRP